VDELALRRVLHQVAQQQAVKRGTGASLRFGSVMPGRGMNATGGGIWYTAGMVKTLELAMSKAAALPEAAQEQLGRELLEHIETLTELRAEIEIGIKELDAGKGEELDIEDVIREARNEHGRRG